MQDEHFMRAWNEGHTRFSADIARAVKWLAEPFRRMGEYMGPASAPGEDSFFASAARRSARPRPRRAR